MNQLVKKYRALEAKRNILKDTLGDHGKKAKEASESRVHHETARLFLQKAASETQNNLKTHLNGLVTLALSCIWPIEFDVTFETKRGKTECVLSFKDEKGNLMSPTEASGGGAIDVASFALRCAFLQLEGNRRLMVLDEPFKFVSRDHLPQAAEMLRLLADKLKLQVICVTHIPEFIEVADKKFHVVKKNGVSVAQ